MKTIKLFALAALVITMSFSAHAGDVLTLTNNMAFEGKVTKIKDCFVVFKSNKEKFVIPAAEIQSIQFESPETNRVYLDYLNPEQQQNKCMSGQLDAEQFHGKQVAHFMYGFLFGPFALIGAALSNPDPYSGKKTAMLSQNKEIFSDYEYLRCYKKKAKNQNVGMAGLGWAAVVVLILVL